MGFYNKIISLRKNFYQVIFQNTTSREDPFVSTGTVFQILMKQQNRKKEQKQQNPTEDYRVECILLLLKKDENLQII